MWYCIDLRLINELMLLVFTVHPLFLFNWSCLLYSFNSNQLNGIACYSSGQKNYWRNRRGFQKVSLSLRFVTTIRPYIRIFYFLGLSLFPLNYYLRFTWWQSECVKMSTIRVGVAYDNFVCIQVCFMYIYVKSAFTLPRKCWLLWNAEDSFCDRTKFRIFGCGRRNSTKFPYDWISLWKYAETTHIVQDISSRLFEKSVLCVWHICFVDGFLCKEIHIFDDLPMLLIKITTWPRI